MSAKTKIVVLHMREVIYTAIFVALGIFLVLLFIYMFLPDDASDKQILPETAPTFLAGIYTSSVDAGNQAMQIEVIVDKNHINSIRLVNLDQTADVSNPLMETTLNNLSAQILSNQSLEGITCSDVNRYTAQTLYDAIKRAVKKASTVSGNGVTAN
ncbi:MAG: hypothetical protein OSJ62_09910 [Lachnospiraceae bacterium]|nr:hypothetical protein [Lachnospiraceae bacterium]